MFDRVTIKAKIDTADTDTIVWRNYLEQYTKSDEVYYKSTSYANLDGVNIELCGDTLKCKCSVNKLFYKKKERRLDNSKPMTFANATRTLNDLLLRLCVKPENAVVTYYEIGLTMVMIRGPEVYIQLAEEGIGRRLWNDPNYPEARQKITEKSKYYRKVLKMYDKTFEYQEKRRPVTENVLRVESIYRHQSVSMVDFLSEDFQVKAGRKFYDDWSSLRWQRELKPTKGVKLSQLAKAREINLLGVEAYLDKYRTMYLAGDLTKKQWETLRTYGKNWDVERLKYTEEMSQEEGEFRQNLLKFFQVGIVTLYR